jgi:hypothetical protein
MKKQQLEEDKNRMENMIQQAIYYISELEKQLKSQRSSSSDSISDFILPQPPPDVY